MDRDNEVNRILGAFKLNPFEQMGLRFDASHEEAKRQYRKVSLLIHPDKCRHPLATSAFEVLGNANQQLQDEDAVRELRHVLNLARGARAFFLHALAMRGCGRHAVRALTSLHARWPCMTCGGHAVRASSSAPHALAVHGCGRACRHSTWGQEHCAASAPCFPRAASDVAMPASAAPVCSSDVQQAIAQHCLVLHAAGGVADRHTARRADEVRKERKKKTKNDAVVRLAAVIHEVTAPCARRSHTCLFWPTMPHLHGDAA